MQELLTYLVLFGLWTGVGWFVIHVLRYGNVSMSLLLYEYSPYKRAANVAGVLAVLLWPFAPLVTLVAGYLILRHMRRKKPNDEINKE